MMSSNECLSITDRDVDADAVDEGLEAALSRKDTADPTERMERLDTTEVESESGDRCRSSPGYCLKYSKLPTVGLRS